MATTTAWRLMNADVRFRPMDHPSTCGFLSAADARSQRDRERQLTPRRSADSYPADSRTHHVAVVAVATPIPSPVDPA
jgi:hypothetical protein